MENNGKSKSVINSTRKELNNLARNADLDQPDEVKALIARMEQATLTNECSYKHTTDTQNTTKSNGKHHTTK
jgi:hypothetical protein